MSDLSSFERVADLRSREQEVSFCKEPPWKSYCIHTNMDKFWQEVKMARRKMESLYGGRL